MSSRRVRGGSIARSEDEINNLLLNLRAILPDQSNSSCTTTTRVPASKILKEACKYIKRLHREADDLSERLSQLLASVDTAGIDADILRSLLQQ
ncbi:hypothetical protein RHGRI_034840 [Rhododendron griersonianum]|uniref:BHLH domain-containing protein n=1 Tax=Rhododendron griersonianum TaxID=479676 RepID=A0AAV6I888_9ERIC|nr:hypothetical protein RHGRI_034840 [Rhododendron griersonianum]